jgi:hypothetical protein
MIPVDTMMATYPGAVGQMVNGDLVISDDGEVVPLDSVQRDPLRQFVDADCDSTPFGDGALAAPEPYQEDDEEDPS